MIGLLLVTRQAGFNGLFLEVAVVAATVEMEGVGGLRAGISPQTPAGGLLLTITAKRSRMTTK